MVWAQQIGESTVSYSSTYLILKIGGWKVYFCWTFLQRNEFKHTCCNWMSFKYTKTKHLLHIYIRTHTQKHIYIYTRQKKNWPGIVASSVRTTLTTDFLLPLDRFPSWVVLLWLVFTFFELLCSTWTKIIQLNLQIFLK